MMAIYKENGEECCEYIPISEAPKYVEIDSNKVLSVLSKTHYDKIGEAMDITNNLLANQSDLIKVKEVE